MPAESLTDAQTERQDEVDNACHSLITDLAGDLGSFVKWDIEHIGAIRDAVQEVLVNKLHLMTEQEFYPYIEETPSIISDDTARELTEDYDHK